jgi:hypothetical protein
MGNPRSWLPEPAWATVARVAPQGLAGEVFVGIRIHGAGDRRGRVNASGIAANRENRQNRYN